MRTFGMSIVMVSLLTAGHALSQSPGNEATSARTAWGHPDLQGVWDFATMTPLERPEGQASEFLSEEEAAAAEQALEQQRAADTVAAQQALAQQEAQYNAAQQALVNQLAEAQQALQDQINRTATVTICARIRLTEVSSLL